MGDAAMQQTRRTLSIKTSPDDLPNVAPDDPAAILSQGIQVKVCVAATYNKATFLLAPHILYTKHDELFVDAMVVERDGKPPKEPKMGTFKLTGLTAVTPTGKRFVPQAEFDALDPKYAETTIRAIKL
jgi:hypothetical protein